MVRYLYNSKGEWIAFCRGRHVFNTDCEWIGWMPFNNNIVVDFYGQYLGTITFENRLYRFLDEPLNFYTEFPGYPGHPEYPIYPGCTFSAILPEGAVDVNTSLAEIYY